MSALVLAGAAAVLVWVLVPPPSRTPGFVAAATQGRHAARLPGRRLVAGPVVLLGAVSLGLVALLGVDWFPLLVAGVVLVATVAVLVGRAGSQRRSLATAQQVARGAQVLSGQLRIGQVPVVALQHAAEDCPVLVPGVAAHRVGGDVPGALRREADRPGAAGLRSLAAAWQLAERSGAPMAEAAERVAADLSDRAQLRRSVAAELAPARATGKLLAVLPLVGIAMGFMVGGSPDEFLVSTTVGRWVLAVAVSLACVGMVWTEWLAEHAERRTR
ncbi:type II secretion system F family protein [Aestuariimicrobium sp. Y1814]|uniref:type II secretion system F family protein n=1 Tax=Aestuariimicrobium sp. Y1814 TaxID=3418742 RepID=UPI003DA6E0AF